jgi:hypothetical protein
MNRARQWQKWLDRWRWIIAPAGAALCALRIGLETVPQRLFWGAAIALLCLVVGYLLHNEERQVSLAPFGLLWLYVAWPLSSPTMAMAVVFVALGATIIHHLNTPSRGRVSPARTGWIVDGAVLSVALLLYVSTLAPTILPADSGEFQIVGPLLGVAHPPGYALFTLLAKLFSPLPFGEVAWRVNLMGAVTGAATLAVVGRTARQIARSPWAGVAAASALGVSTTFWAQSTTINIRALIVLLTALCFHFLVNYILAAVNSKKSRAALTGLAASLGLLIAHHYPQAALAPLFGLVVLWCDPGLLKRARAWPRYLLAFVLPFFSDLYIVVRAIVGAPFGTEELTSAGRVIDHLLGRGFSGDMFAFLRLNRILWERALVIENILRFQFGVPLLIVAAAGFGWLLWKRHELAALVGGTFAVMVFIVATYRAPQSVEYLMPAYVPLALCIGCAVPLVNQLPSLLLRRAQDAFRQAQDALRRAQDAFRQAPPSTSSSFNELRIPNPQSPIPNPQSLIPSLLTATLLLPILFLFRAHLPSYVQLHHDRSAREYAESVLLDAPPNAHILSNWHWYTPLKYLQLVEGQRTDVQVTYLYPQGTTEMPQAWPQRIQSELDTSARPLIVTNHYPTYGDLPYRFTPQGEAFRLHVEPSAEIPTNLDGLDVDFAEEDQAVVRLLGYRIAGPQSVGPGDRVTVDLAWQPLVRLARGYSFYVHLVGDDGVPLGQRDRRHDAAPTYEPGEVLIDRYEFSVFLHATPGTYRLIAGVYWAEDGAWQRLTAEDGSDAVTLTTVSIVPASLPPVTAHALHHTFRGGPTLVGVDYDDTLSESRRVYLHWRLGPRPALARLYAGRQEIARGTVPGDERSGYVSTVLDVPPGTEDLRLALSLADTGAALPAKGAWSIASPAPIRLPHPQRRQHYLPFGGKMALIGAYAGDTWTAGEQERVALHFLGLRPIVRDYVISLGTRGARVFASPSDGVPAIGAMPTFKWIRGSSVRDVHLLQVYPDASGEAELNLGVYDAFTTGGLPPLDERFARQGRADVPLQWISVP